MIRDSPPVRVADSQRSAFAQERRVVPHPTSSAGIGDSIRLTACGYTRLASLAIFLIACGTWEPSQSRLRTSLNSVIIGGSELTASCEPLPRERKISSGWNGMHQQRPSPAIRSSVPRHLQWVPRMDRRPAGRGKGTERGERDVAKSRVEARSCHKSSGMQSRSMCDAQQRAPVITLLSVSSRGSASVSAVYSSDTPDILEQLSDAQRCPSGPRWR
jgi:hypothetical protein